MLWRTKFALLWGAKVLVQNLTDLLRSGFNLEKMACLVYSAVYLPAALALFVRTGYYRSKYGGMFLFDRSKRDELNLVRMDLNCPPDETMVAYAFGLTSIPTSGETIKRNLIHTHVLACDRCQAECAAIDELIRETPETPET